MADSKTELTLKAKDTPLSERILAEAASLFSEVGTGSASMRVLAERLGVTKAALYYHYRSKDELHLQIHLKVIDGALASAAAIQQADQSAREKVRALVGLILESINAHRDEFTVLLREGTRFRTPPWDVVWEKRERFRRIVRDILVDGTRDREFEIDEPEIATLALLGMCNWAYTWLNPNGRLTVPELAEVFTSIFLHGIDARAGGSVVTRGVMPTGHRPT